MRRAPLLLFAAMKGWLRELNRGEFHKIGVLQHPDVDVATRVADGRDWEPGQQGRAERFNG
jgi:hypothetical protein